MLIFLILQLYLPYKNNRDEKIMFEDLFIVEVTIVTK